MINAPLTRTTFLLTAFLATLIAILVARTVLGDDVTSPAEHLGRPVGADFTLADWQEESSYFRRLADESPNVITQKVGTTTEGRDFLISIISSEANLRNLDAIRKRARIIADPRGHSEIEINDAINNGKVILFVSCAMHSTEVAGSQFGMELAYTLATSNEEPWKSARDNMVVVVFVTNPDGVDVVTDWYRKTVDTPYETAGLLRLYQYYAGHDNNRDWFMLTQNETQIVSALLYHEWFPQMYWDVHQQGSRGERLFVPPYRDPLNPNLDPNIITAIDAIGSRALMDMTRAEFTGIATGVTYDMWWNGGNRNVPVRHNIVGILTEAASADLATPIFLPIEQLRSPTGQGGYAPSNRFPDPWPGGWWRLRDIIDYEMGFARSFLSTISREPETWLRNTYEAAGRAIEQGLNEAPRAWVIPSDSRDPDAVSRLADILLRTGVEMHVAKGDFDADGRTYPAGSIVIHRAQPYGRHVKDLMEVQRYPEGDPPYDVAGWTVPFLLGVHRVEVNESLADRDLEIVATVEAATRAFQGDGRLRNRRGIINGRDAWSIHNTSTWREISKALRDGTTISFITDGMNSGMFVEGLTRQDAVSLLPIEKHPRIAIYSPWSGSMDEGWMRYLFDRYGIPYISVKNEMLRAGKLHEIIDVLVIPSMRERELDDGRSPGSVPSEFTRGLDPEGATAIEAFVRTGGTLVVSGSSCDWAIDLFDLPLEDATRGDGSDDFSCPGSVLRSVAEPGLPFTADLPDSIPLFFSRSRAFRIARDAGDDENEFVGRVDTLLRYAPERVLLSGWIRDRQVIENKAGWCRASYGEGAIHLFGFQPQYRGWSQSTFPLLFRAIFLEQGARDMMPR